MIDSRTGKEKDGLRISPHALFERLNLSGDEKENLRRSLMLFKALTLADVSNAIQNQAENLATMHYVLLTSATFSGQNFECHIYS